jgi:RNA-directed DNA polymerase
MNIEEVQRRLWEQSHAHKQHRESGTPLFPTNRYDGRIRNLMDLMHNPTWIAAACDRVMQRSRGKAPGVDGVTTHVFSVNRESRLEQLRLELKRGTYRPQPLRRVEIPKANGKMRQLGIPCLRDKIVQEAIRMALEPIFEVEFHDSSYGFRPKRSAHHAVARCRHSALVGFTWIIEGDVKACFDEISHKAILRGVKEKVIDNRFLALIQLLLKAGVEIDGVFHPTTKGVPQGGVASPLLANIVLNKLDWFLHSKGFYDEADKRFAQRHNMPNIRFCRYADDWCVFLTRASRERAERLRDEIRDFLRETCGLELSAEKTRITHVRNGYDFLGFHVSVGTGKSGELVPKIRIGRKAITNIQRRLAEALRYRPTQEGISVRLDRASAVIRGWSNYFKIAHNFSQVAHGLDHRAFWTAVNAICRKAGISAAKCLRRHRFGNTIGVHEACTLACFADTVPVHYYASPEPYRPDNCQRYPEDDEWETAFVYHERGPGCGDLKWQALIRDGFHCRGCAAVVTSKTSQADHIEPVNRFANLAMANHLDNIQTLCLRCHNLKSARDRGE